MNIAAWIEKRCSEGSSVFTRKDIRAFVILLIAWLVFILVMSGAKADPIRDYPHPIVCKPIVIVDEIVQVSSEEHWITLEWKDFVAFGKDRLLFKHLDKIFYLEKNMRAKGYICS